MTLMRLSGCQIISNGLLKGKPCLCSPSFSPVCTGDCVLPSSVSSGHLRHVAWQQDPCSLGKHHRAQQTHTGQN